MQRRKCCLVQMILRDFSRCDVITQCHLSITMVPLTLRRGWGSFCSTRLWPGIIALWWWFAHAVLGVPCETTRHGCSLWCLYPHYPFSIHIFCLVINIEKTSLVKILGNFSFVSIYYHWNWFEDLHHVLGIEIKDDSEMLHSQYLRENNGTTCHHGHPADCQLALRNVVEVQTKVVTND